MPTVYLCPNPGCAKRYHAAPALAGKLSRCKKCGRVHRIPAPGEDAVPHDPPPLELDDDPPPRRTPWVYLTGVGAVTVVLSVVLAAGGLDAYRNRFRSARGPAAPDGASGPAVRETAGPASARKATDPDLIGSWVQTGIGFSAGDGKPASWPHMTELGSKYIFRDGRLTIANNRKVTEFELETDHAVTPRVARWHPAGGKAVVVVYEIKGDELWVYAQAGPDPPKQIAPVEGVTRFSMQFVRLGPSPAEPKTGPKAEPKVEPKVEPKAEPRAEPMPAPKSEPKAAPAAALDVDKLFPFKAKQVFTYRLTVPAGGRVHHDPFFINALGLLSSSATHGTAELKAGDRQFILVVEELIPRPGAPTAAKVRIDPAGLDVLLPPIKLAEVRLSPFRGPDKVGLLIEGMTGTKADALGVGSVLAEFPADEADPEEVTVPAGKFRAYRSRVSHPRPEKAPAFAVEAWAAEGVGLVKLRQREAGGQIGFTVELAGR